MRLKLPSPAMCVALVALFVAGSGSAYAAKQLAKNSVGTPQIQKGAVTAPKIAKKAIDSAKIKDGSVALADLASGARTKPLRKGEMLTGVLGADLETPGAADFVMPVSFSIPASSAPTSYDPGSSPNCTGSIANPTAPAGVVCVYAGSASNDLIVSPGPAPKHGFTVGWNATEAGDTFLYGSWAYRQG